MTSKQWVTLWSIMLCCYRMVFTSCDRCISILAVSLIFCSLGSSLHRWCSAAMIEMTTSDKKNNYTSPVWGRYARKWREMEKAVGEAESCSRTRDDIGTYCQYWQYLIAKCKKSHFLSFCFCFFVFHYLRLLYWLINLFYSFKKWDLRFSMSKNLFLNIPYPFNFLPKYPVSLWFFTQISLIPITPNRASHLYPLNHQGLTADTG